MFVLCFNSLGMQISTLSETVFHNLYDIKELWFETDEIDLKHWF